MEGLNEAFEAFFVCHFMTPTGKENEIINKQKNKTENSRVYVYNI